MKNHEQLEAMRMQIVTLAGWEVGDRYKMRHGRRNEWTTRMCRHPQIIKGRWRSISHLPNPAYNLRECVELEQQLLTEDVQIARFSFHLLTIVFEGVFVMEPDAFPPRPTLDNLKARMRLYFTDVTKLLQATPAQRLEAMILTLEPDDKDWIRRFYRATRQELKRNTAP